jgi:hypothetical protein
VKNQDLLPMTVELVPRPAACYSCRHYHGKKEFGVALYCGLYPGGPAIWNQCADWEGEHE